MSNYLSRLNLKSIRWILIRTMCSSFICFEDSLILTEIVISFVKANKCSQIQKTPRLVHFNAFNIHNQLHYRKCSTENHEWRFHYYITFACENRLSVLKFEQFMKPHNQNVSSPSQRRIKYRAVLMNSTTSPWNVHGTFSLTFMCFFCGFILSFSSFLLSFSSFFGIMLRLVFGQVHVVNFFS